MYSTPAVPAISTTRSMTSAPKCGPANGTSTRAPGAFDSELEASGARNNASTSSDVTVYQDWFPGAALELVFDLESDPAEKQNLMSTQPAVADRLGARLREWQHSVLQSLTGADYQK